MQPRLILFDIDGTLIDTGGAGRKAMEQACRNVFQVNDVAKRSAGVRYAGMTDPLILDALARALGIDAHELETSRDEVLRSFVQELKAELARPEPRRRVLPGVRELLSELTSRDEAHLGLATGNIEAGARAKLEALGLWGFFAGGGFSSDHPQRRELARLGWLKLSRQLGIAFPPEHVVVVGDTERDVDCAKANGFRSVAVNSGWVPRAALEQAGPDALLDDLADLDRSLRALGFE